MTQKRTILSKNGKNSFSLLEVIFVIAVIAIITSVAVPKLQKNFTKSDTLKIKADIALIKEGIYKYKNKMILQASLPSLHTLEEDDTLLFSKVLQYPIVDFSQSNKSHWEKISDTQYDAHLNGNTKVRFIYDPSDFTFECDTQNSYCKDLIHYN